MGLLGICIVYPLAVDSSLSFFTVCGAVFFSGIGNVITFYFQSKYIFLLQTDGKLYITTNLTTVVTVLTSLAKVVLISLGVNIVFILAAAFAIQCLQTVYILLYVRRHYPQLDLRVKPNYEAVAQKNSVLVHQISSLIFRNTDVLILTVFCGLKVVSVYSMFKLVTTHLETLLDIPFNSINFALGQTYHTDKTLFCKRISVVESYYSAAVYALFSVALFLFIPFMRLYTAGVTDVNYIDPLLALMFVLCSVMEKSRGTMLATIGYAGHFRATLRPAIIESTINLTVSLLGVYFLGIYGVLLGTIAALLYRTNDIILYSNRRLLQRSAWHSYSIYVVNITLFIATQLLFRLLFDEAAITSYFRFALVGAGCSVLSLLILLGGQTVLFPHCRQFARQILDRVLHRT